MRIETFGGFRVTTEEGVIDAEDWTSQKAFSLFRYLVCKRNRRIPLEEIYELFWKDMDEEYARSNLNTTLYLIRKTVGLTPEELHLKGDTCGFFPSKRVEIDADALETLHSRLKHANLSREDKEKILADLREMYRGPFMVEDPYEEWVEEERERYESMYTGVLRESLNFYLQEGRYEEASEVLRIYLRREPYDEQIYYKAMEILKREGNITQVVNLYQRMKERLRELNLEPQLTLEEVLKQDEKILQDGNKAIVVSKELFDKLTLIESRKRNPDTIAFVLTFKEGVDVSLLSKKLASLLRKGDVVSVEKNRMYLLINCSPQRRQIVEDRIIKALGEMGIEKEDYDVAH